MLSALLGLIVFLIIIGFLVWLVGLAPIDATVKQIIRGVILLILILGCLLWIASFFGFSPTFGAAMRRSKSGILILYMKKEFPDAIIA